MLRTETRSRNNESTWWPDLSHRSCDTELMDSLESDETQLINTLKQFRTINRWLTPCHRLIKRHFLAPMQAEPKRQWSLLDLGAGGGDLPIWLAKHCRKSGIKIEITCMDYDPRVVEFLKQRCSEFANIDIVQADALQLSSIGRKWDFVFANHFLHHLSDDDLITIVSAVNDVAANKYVLSDLLRSRLSYMVYSALLPLRMTNSFAWHDGRISIRKAFTLKDGQNLITSARVDKNASVRSFFPGHLAIVGTHSSCE